MNIKSTQIPLPFHNVGRTQALRERLEANEAAKQDIVDIITLPEPDALIRISAREDAGVAKRLEGGSERKWAKRCLSASALTFGGAVALGSAGCMGPSLALGASGLLLFCIGGSNGIEAYIERDVAGQVESLVAKHQLLDEVRADPELIPHLRSRSDWLEENRAPDLEPGEKTKKQGLCGALAGGASVILRTPQILTTPLVNAIWSPDNLAEEVCHEAMGVTALAFGVGALTGGGVIANAMMGLPGSGGTIGTICTIASTVAGATAGGAVGAAVAKSINGLTTPLNIGRQTLDQLGEGEHSTWSQYTQGVGLAVKSAYEIGRS